GHQGRAELRHAQPLDAEPAGAREREAGAGPEGGGQHVEGQGDEEDGGHDEAPCFGYTHCIVDHRMTTKTPRPYESSLRAQSAGQTRAQLTAAAAQLLREHADFRAVTLDAVAKAAGVTRLTVYHQFGSRQGLLEAVFDELAVQGGLHRIAEAMAMPDARA